MVGRNAVEVWKRSRGRRRRSTTPQLPKDNEADGHCAACRCPARHRRREPREPKQASHRWLTHSLTHEVQESDCSHLTSPWGQRTIHLTRSATQQQRPGSSGIRWAPKTGKVPRRPDLDMATAEARPFGPTGIPAPLLDALRVTACRHDDADTSPTADDAWAWQQWNSPQPEPQHQAQRHYPCAPPRKSQQ